MKTLTLTIGHNIGTSGAIAWRHADVLAAVRDILAPEGYTAYETSGMWQGVAESSTRVELAGLDQAEAERMAAAVPVLARALMQDAIYCELSPCASYPVYAIPAAGAAVATA